MRYAADALPPQLHALVHKPARLVRTLVLPRAVETWSLNAVRERFIRTGTRLVRHGCYALFLIAEVALPRSVLLVAVQEGAGLGKCGPTRRETPNRRR